MGVRLLNAILKRTEGAHARLFLLAVILCSVAACGGGRDQSRVSLPPPTAVEPEAAGTLRGFIIDGPVAGADVVITDAAATEVARTTTDSEAKFSTTIAEDAVYPLMVTATGGINLTTDRAPDIVIRGVVSSQDARHVVASSMSTLVIARAECLATQNNESLADGIRWLTEDPERAVAFLSAHGFGLDPEQHTRLLGGQPADPEGAVSLLLASESLAETLRRATAALNEAGIQISQDELLWAVACDLGDDVLDGSGPDADPQPIAAYQAAATAVKLEAGTGQMMIAERDENVASLLEQAVVDTFGFAGSAPIASLPVGGDFLDVLRNNVYALLASAPSEALFDLYGDLLATHPDTPRSELQTLVADRTALEPLLLELLLAAAGDAATAEAALDDRLGRPESALPPQIELVASPTTLAARGMSTSLAYAAEHAQVCRRLEGEAGAWPGLSGPAAELETGPIHGNTSFLLSCAGPGGITTTGVDIIVPPAARIVISQTSDTAAGFIALGEELRVEIEVADGEQEECRLVRSDTGAEMAPGDTLFASPDIDLNLTCEGPGGMAMSTLTLPVRAASLSWIPPSETEGSEPLTLADLRGYRIYHGSTSGQYDRPVIIIDEPEVTQYTDAFPPGTRYFVITAVSRKGIESSLSNEVVRDIP